MAGALDTFLESLWRASGLGDEKPDADDSVCDSNFGQKTRKENVFILYPLIVMYWRKLTPDKNS